MHDENEEQDDDYGMEVIYAGQPEPFQDLPDTDDSVDDYDDLQTVSKSQKKREHHELLKLAEHALTLSDDNLRQTGLDEKILAAFTETRKMRKSGARNRQLKYITKLLANTDSTELEAFLERADQSREHDKNHFHQLERLRDNLIEQGDAAIAQVADLYPLAERQHLRTLIRQAQKEQAQDKAPAASRKIFKYLRSISET